VLGKQSRALSRTMDAYFDTLLTQLFGNTAINAVKCILFASYLEECGDSAMTIFETISRQNQVHSLDLQMNSSICSGLN
jgi:hypothetical protein